MRQVVVLLQVMLVAPPVWAQQARTASHSPVRSLQLTLAPHVTEELDALADTLRVETVRCLIGVVSGQTATIDLAWEPPIELSRADLVHYQSCPSATLALWHNHPPIAGEDPEYACYLSATDIREALDPRSPPIQIVQVTADVACWWSQWEIQRTGQLPVLLPKEKQRWGRSVPLDEASCRGEFAHLVACQLLLICERGTGANEACARHDVGENIARVGRADVPVEERNPCREPRSLRPECAPPQP